MINISKMNSPDLETIKHLLTTDFDDFWNLSILQSELDNSRSYYIIAKEDREILGFAGIIDTVDQFEITNIVVKKTCRHKGVGTLLLNELIEYAKKNNKNKIFLEVNEKNIPAIKLYEKNGFKKCGFRKKYYNNIDNAILMTLHLE